MYTIVEDSVIDEVKDDLSEDGRKKVRDAKAALRKNPKTADYGAKEQKDGSWQIAISVGVRKVLLGYDIDEKQRLILLNYLKWDRFREVLDWTIGLLAPEPGKKK